MKEILGNNLQVYMNSPNIEGALKYQSDDYEVWEVQDEYFEYMANQTEAEFRAEVKNDDAWWRYCIGSVLTYPLAEAKIHGRQIIVWEDLDKPIEREYDDLMDYLNNYIGASTEKNVCACAMDLAKFNGMKMSELFRKYQ